MPLRSALIQGPAKVVYTYTPPSTTVTFHCQDDITTNIIRRTVPIRTAIHGVIDQRDQDIALETSIRPDGRWSTDLISALWPYANSAIGDPLYVGAADKTLVLHGTDGAKHTWASAAVTKMPDLLFSTQATLIGEVGFTGLASDNSTWATASRLLTIGTGASPVDTAFTVSGIKTQAYTGALTGVTGLTSFETLDGFRVSFNLETEDLSLDNQGVYQKVIRSVGVAVRCIPIGPTSAQILSALKIQDTGSVRGRSLDAGSSQFTITGADTIPYLTIPHCSVETGAFRFGSSAQALRVGEIALVATRNFSSGAQQALWSMSNTPA